MSKIIRRAPRGYLLAEVMFAGAILAVTIAATLSLIASSAADQRYGSNRGVAGMLARAKADELASATNCTPGNQGTLIVVDAATYPQFRWMWTVANAGNSASSTPPITAGTLCDIVVTVRYPAVKGSLEDIGDGTTDGEALLTFNRMYKP
ncbi:MAG: hypothetical protein IT383_20575 [Deltaproteobacteria bacterium]|nr:hypothetical protein [Deltaproteobacteria bacterium]